jgi:hypothetical protein
MELLKELNNKIKLSIDELIEKKILIRVMTVEECKDLYHLLKEYGRIIPSDESLEFIYDVYKDKTVIEFYSNSTSYSEIDYYMNIGKEIYKFSEVYIVKE